MKRSYQDVIEQIKQIALAHPMVKSVDDGRDLEFDVKKNNVWPRVFIKTDSTAMLGGEGTAETTLLLSVLVMDRLNTKRSNIEDAINDTHGILLSLWATLNMHQLIRLDDNPTAEPRYDYHDSQSAGWETTMRVYMTGVIECYPVN